MLFTPGPLSTSKKVKEATLHDMGSRDFEFIGLVKDIREQLLKLAGVSIDSGFECIIIQGSGTYSIESVISSALSDTDHLLLLINGAYGERMRKIAGVYQIQTSVLNFPEDQIPSVERLRQTLEEDHSITHVAAVHCETTSGIYNPIAEIGAICESYKKTFIVDAMSSFGAVPVNMSILIFLFHHQINVLKEFQDFRSFFAGGNSCEKPGEEPVPFHSICIPSGKDFKKTDNSVSLLRYMQSWPLNRL